jgi:hypothetical protein
LRLGGTCTGEHGIGLHKMDFLVTEAGIGAVNRMRTLKQALDPHNIMNPGKIIRKKKVQNLPFLHCIQTGKVWSSFVQVLVMAWLR